MALLRLALRDFRNIAALDWTPAPGVNVIHGDNGQGKTSLLEAVYVLANQKSFRTACVTEAIREQTAGAQLTADLLHSGVRHRVDVTLGETERRRLLNGKEPENFLRLFELLRPVLFWPEDVAIIRGTPALRRNLVDRALFTVDTSYLGHAQVFQRVVRQRNQVLRSGDAATLPAWDEELATAGARLRGRRAAFLHRLRPFFVAAYKAIAEDREAADLRYDWPEEDAANRARLEQEIFRVRERELRLGQTLAGPHRDNPEFTLDGRPARSFASQGQQRSLILAFRLGLLKLMETEGGEPPLLLLDDLTSELDGQREQFVLSSLVRGAGQVFLTTTDRHRLERALDHRAVFFRMHGGRLSPDAME